MKFGIILKELRVKNRLTQDYIAKYLGVTRPNITQYEMGLYEPSIETLNKLAKLFRVDVSYLMGQKSVMKVPIVGISSCGRPTSNDSQENDRFANYNGEYWNKDLYCV
ncbi:MAG: helix-turn-helix domain-containing protein, partial [Campylobacteraceae bacterium]|nr:helix-turn-helix domain-containing protein [Campylobacteraceae bacterium]